VGDGRGRPVALKADGLGVVEGVERARVQLDRLEASLDRAFAVLTRPAHQSDLPLPSLGSVSRPSVDAPLWRDHVRYARRRDAPTRDRLVQHYLPYARSLATRSFRHREPLDDLRQVATEGLLVALNRFRPERRRPFLAYASPTITGMIKHHYRDTGWSLRVPRWVHDLTQPIRRAQEMLEQDLGRPPTDAEIADLLDLDEDQILAARRAERARSTTSIDAAVFDDDRPVSGQLRTHDHDLRYDQIDNWTAVAQTVRLLPEEDRELLRMYYVENMSQAAIAARRGVSQMQISRLLGGIVRRLRSHLADG
jgi:RNA polymerase sigma-B factor